MIREEFEDKKQILFTFKFIQQQHAEECLLGNIIIK